MSVFSLFTIDYRLAGSPYQHQDTLVMVRVPCSSVYRHSIVWERETMMSHEFNITYYGSKKAEYLQLLFS